MESDRPDGAHAVYVVATTEAATRRALETAARRANAQGGRVVVIVPHPVPRGVDPCGCDLLRLADEYCELGESSQCPTTVVVCVCREMCDVCWMIPANPSAPSQIVVAGHRRWWHRSREERLMRALEREGRAVEFIDLAAPVAENTVSGTF